MKNLCLYIILMTNLHANASYDLKQKNHNNSQCCIKDEMVPSYNQKVSEKAIKSTKNIASKKYGLQCIGVGAGGNYDRLGLDFYYYKPLKMDEARNIVLYCSAFFKESISKEIVSTSGKESLDYNPSIGITIYSVNKNYKHYPDPWICVVSANSDGVIFRTDDPENEFKYKNTFTETLEEAEEKNREYLEKLNSNQNPDS